MFPLNLPRLCLGTNPFSPAWAPRALFCCVYILLDCSYLYLSPYFMAFFEARNQITGACRALVLTEDLQMWDFPEVCSTRPPVCLCTSVLSAIISHLSFKW